LNKAQNLANPLRYCLPPGSADFEAEGDVLGNRHVRQERIVLEQHSNVALMDRDPGDRVPIEKISLAFGSRRPAILRSVVVLPQPLGPSSATIFPASIFSDT
jgi:hypothetical protein